MVAPLRNCRRHIAAFAIVVVVLGVCLGATQQTGPTGERHNATIVNVGLRHAPASMNFDGVLPIAAAALVAITWATQRAARVRTLVPVASTLIQRRGPPAFAH